MSEIVYHRATAKDLNDLVDYRIEFLLSYWGKQPVDDVNNLRDNLKSFFNKHISDNTYICYFAKQGNIVAGIGGMIIREQPGNFKNPGGRYGYIMNMYTVPAFRRRGICSTILRKLEEEGKKMGITAFELHATKEGEQVYPKQGYKLHGEPTYRKHLEK